MKKTIAYLLSLVMLFGILPIGMGTAGSCGHGRIRYDPL